MFLECLGVDSEVINVDVGSVTYHVTEYFVHRTLESCRCIAWSKWHSVVFPVTVMSDESCFFSRLSHHVDLVVTHEEVDGREVSQASFHVLEDVGDSWDGKRILLGELVEES